MATLKELRDIRLQKLQSLIDKGINAYPAVSNKSIDNQEIIDNYKKHEGNTHIVAGRIISLRSHGKIVFIDIRDLSGTVQLYIKRDDLKKPNYKNSELSFEDIDDLDLGDFIEAEGEVLKTQSGQISVQPKTLRILTKSLRPLPSQWDGFKDKEERLRRRYIDTNINEDVRERFIRRAKYWEAHRMFLNERGFYEINIPVLESIPGGGDANPFVTHMDALGEDFFLRISHELYLKRLIGGGYEKVYEIGPRFRNEGLSPEHLPEHIAMEFYWAYANWEDGMKFIEEMFSYVIDYVYGEQKVFNIRGFEVDFSKKWERLDFAEIMQDKFGFDIHNVELDEVLTICKKHKIDLGEGANIARCVDNLWKLIRKDIAGPAFLINHPKYLSPLSKSKFDNPHITERIQPIIAGSELGNGWSELNDPQDQLERFVEQQELREAGDDEAQWLDIDYVEMLEYGMPPTFGWGHSERVFWFLEDVTAREGVPFPQLRHHIDDVTLGIYGEDVTKFLVSEDDDENEGCCGGQGGCACGNGGSDVSECCGGGHGGCACGNKDEAKNECCGGEKDDCCGGHDHDHAQTDKIDLNAEGILPTREEAQKMLEDHVQDEYQKKHALMVATALEAYAEKLGEDKDLWYLTGLLHDVDYFEHPDEHPKESLKWFADLGYSPQLIHAVSAHAHGLGRTDEEPQTQLAWALIAVDELAGFLYAYSLMRPEGFEGMKAKSIKKKFKDKGFAAKVDRNEIMYGVEGFGVDFGEHAMFLVDVFKPMNLS